MKTGHFCPVGNGLAGPDLRSHLFTHPMVELSRPQDVDRATPTCAPINLSLFALVVMS